MTHLDQGAPTQVMGRAAVVYPDAALNRPSYGPPQPAERRTAPTPERLPVTGGLLVALPAMVATLAISMFGIGTRSLWNDEYATWYASTLSWTDLFRLLSHVDAVLTPYYLAMHGWIAVFGDSPASLRVPSAVAMAAAAGVIALIGRRLFDPGVGFTAGLLFAALPAVSRYGEEARPYAFAILAAAGATLLLLRAVDAPSWRRWMFYGGCLVVAGLLHIVTLTILLPHAVHVWRAFRTHDDFRMFRWIGSVLLAVTVALPLAAKGSQQSSAISWIKADGNAVKYLPVQLFGSAQVAIAVIVIGSAAAWLLWSAHRNAAWLLLAWAVFPPLFCYVTFPILHLFLFRYVLFTIPAWTLLAASAGFALTRLIRSDEQLRRFSLSALLVVAGVLYVGLPGQIDARRSPVNGEPDFRGAADAVVSGMRPHDGIAFAGNGRNGRIPFAYELRGRAVPADVFVARTSQQNGEFGAQECDRPTVCVKDTQRVWLVSATEQWESPFAGMPDTTKTFLASAFTVAEYYRTTRVRVYVLTRKVER